MYYSSTVVGLVLISVILCPGPGQGAPRSKSQSRDKPISATTYDQKQTGEYNIQLHLKDFQIIAVVGEDSLGMGEYDYNYDYSEFTIKPQSNTTTSKPTDFESISTLVNETSPNQNLTNTAGTTTKKPFMHQHFSTTSKKPIKTTKTTVKPQPTTKIPTPTNEEIPITNAKPSSTQTTSPTSPVTTIKTVDFVSSTISSLSSDKIPVAIQDYNNPNEHFDELNLRKHDETKNNELLQRLPVTNVAIVPSEEAGGAFEDDMEPTDQLTLGEIMQYRRCALGYARDKRGRCRKIRRPSAINQAPQLPLGITRFASNIAARFRQATSSPANNLLHQQQQEYNSSLESNEPDSDTGTAAVS